MQETRSRLLEWFINLRPTTPLEVASLRTQQLEGKDSLVYCPSPLLNVCTSASGTRESGFDIPLKFELSSVFVLSLSPHQRDTYIVLITELSFKCKPFLKLLAADSSFHGLCSVHFEAN